MTPEQARAQEAAGLPTTPFHERLAATAPQDQALHRALLGALVDGAAPALAAAASDAGLSDEQAADGHTARSVLDTGGLDGVVLEIADAVAFGGALFGQLPAGSAGSGSR